MDFSDTSVRLSPGPSSFKATISQISLMRSWRCCRYSVSSSWKRWHWVGPSKDTWDILGYDILVPKRIPGSARSWGGWRGLKFAAERAMASLGEAMCDTSRPRVSLVLHFFWRCWRCWICWIQSSPGFAYLYLSLLLTSYSSIWNSLSMFVHSVQIWIHLDPSGSIWIL